MSWILNEYSSEDWENLKSFWKLTDIWADERNDSEESIETTLKYQGRLWIIKHPTEKFILGTAWVTCDGRRIHIHHLGVHPEFRRRGIGTALIEKSIDYARHLECQVRLDMHKENDIARNFYRKFGFHTFDDYDILVLRNIP